MQIGDQWLYVRVLHRHNQGSLLAHRIRVHVCVTVFAFASFALILFCLLLQVTHVCFAFNALAPYIISNIPFGIAT